MHGNLEPEENIFDEEEHPSDLWDDMAKLNSLYEELMDSVNMHQTKIKYDCSCQRQALSEII